MIDASLTINRVPWVQMSRLECGRWHPCDCRPGAWQVAKRPRPCEAKWPSFVKVQVTWSDVHIKQTNKQTNNQKSIAKMKDLHQNHEKSNMDSFFGLEDSPKIATESYQTLNLVFCWHLFSTWSTRWPRPRWSESGLVPGLDRLSRLVVSLPLGVANHTHVGRREESRCDLSPGDTFL